MGRRRKHYFTYLVEGFLASEFTSLRNQIISRYAGFYRKLSTPSREICGLVGIVSKLARGRQNSTALPE